MADNVTLPAVGTPGGTTNPIVATDNIGGAHYQRVKATWGPDGTANDADVATGKPLPVQVRTATGLVPLGEPTDAKNTATDTTSVAVIPLLKQISASVQAPPSQAVTNAGTFAAQPQPSASGGLSIYKSLDLDEGTCEVIKASPGCLYGMWVTNRATSIRYIKFYDAVSGTIGTGTPVITFAIPGNASDSIGAILGPGAHGIAFTTGICFGASTGFADNDTGAPGTNDIIVTAFFK